MISLLEAIFHVTYLKVETLEPSFNFAKIYTYTHFFTCFLMELQVVSEKQPEIFLEVFINTSLGLIQELCPDCSIPQQYNSNTTPTVPHCNIS